MVAISKIQAVWTGFIGAPGVSTFYIDNVDVNLAPFEEFFQDIKPLFSPDVHIDFEESGAILESETGVMTGVWNAEAITPMIGTGSDIYSATSGAMVRWITNAFIDSRRVIGKTYLVPISASLYDGSGNVSATATDLIDVGVNALLSTVGTDLVVWHRPVEGAGGSIHPVLSHLAPSRPVVLRSRRD